ncbi:hypothetical protein GGF50DRAFT_122049 [Schizophyllum commune]
MHTLLPTTILDDLALVTIAAVPPMRPTRDSQAMEITLDTPARPSHEGSRPSLARKTIPGPDIIDSSPRPRTAGGCRAQPSNE